MSKHFIVVRIDTASSGDLYETIGPRTSGYASFEEADTEAQTLNRRYPRAKFAVFQRRAVYDSVTGIKRSLDGKPGEMKSNIAEFEHPKRAVG